MISLTEEYVMGLMKRIGYMFRDPHLLIHALVHKSYLHEKDRDNTITENNERLEFLGDAVLELVVTDYLYHSYSDKEGYLTSLRSALVNYKTIGEVGIELGLENLILLSHGERAELGKARLTIVADAVEALIGALYLDGGYGVAQSFIQTYVIAKLDSIITNQSYKDAKTLLQETVQKTLQMTPVYHLIDTKGQDHDKTFTVAVHIKNKKIATGVGKSKQDAQTEAAQQALTMLKSGKLQLTE